MEKDLEQLMAFYETAYEPDHSKAASLFNFLHYIYKEQGMYRQAEDFYKQVLALLEKQKDKKDWPMANCLANLGLVYKKQGKYAQAEPLYDRVLILRRRFGVSKDTNCTALPIVKKKPKS